jgi:ClpP class serine protease
VEAAEELAGGRIYGGSRAKELGLVDELTGFEGARQALVAQLGLDGATTPLLHLPDGSKSLTLSAGLGLTAASAKPQGTPLVEAVIDALGLGRLVRLARPLLTARTAAPMLHFDGQLPEL